MHTPFNSLYGAAGSAAAVIPGWLWHLSQRRIRMASTSEELLDLFEERYSEKQERKLQQKSAVMPSAASPLRSRASECDREDPEATGQ